MYKQKMRCATLLLFLCVILTTISETCLADVRDDLNALADIVRESQSRMDIIDEKLFALQSEKETSEKDLNAARYALAKNLHALYAMDQTPLYLSFLKKDGSFLHRYYAYRTQDNRTKMIEHLAGESLSHFTQIDKEIQKINHYKEEQTLLEIAINNHLHALQSLSSHSKPPQDLQSKIDALKTRHSSLNTLITSLVDLPALSLPTTDNAPFILPLSGVIEQGGTLAHSGIQIRSRARALVNAPSSGIILYADQFKNLGQIVMIRHGNGYISILKGFETIYVSAGQAVSQKDPLGIAASQNMGANSNGAMLYYELRYNGKVINPLTALSGL